MSGDQIDDHVRDFEAMFRQAIDAWRQPDAVDQLEQIDLRADRNAHGVFARLTPLLFSRQRRAADRVDECLDRMRFAIIAR
jgi:hypothetical protein